VAAYRTAAALQELPRRGYRLRVPGAMDGNDRDSGLSGNCADTPPPPRFGSPSGHRITGLIFPKLSIADLPCVIGTLSLAPLGANIGPLIILAPDDQCHENAPPHRCNRRIFTQHWFEHSIAEFGESQGMLATGFVMVDMVDPSRQTDVVRDYSYRQIITRPILSGGFMTALAVPLIDAVGLPAFRSRLRRLPWH
jgi:hypothetical protein